MVSIKIIISVCIGNTIIIIINIMTISIIIIAIITIVFENKTWIFSLIELKKKNNKRTTERESHTFWQT